MAEKNYTVGRGKLYFSLFKPGTREPEGFRFLGNAPSFSISFSADTLDHYQSTGGIKEKDASVVLQTNRAGSMTLDDIQPENVAFALFGRVQDIAVAAASGQTETISGVKKGFYYPIGVSSATPSGALNIQVTGAAVGATSLVDGTDYEYDQATGFFRILPGSTSVNDGDSVTVTYDQVAYTRTHIPAGNEPVDGALRFVEYNPVGSDHIWYAPYVQIRPDGDMQLIGDDWREIPLSLEILKKDDSTAALYVDGKPAV